MSIAQAENLPEKLSPAELLERHRYKGKLTPMFQDKALRLIRGGSPPRTALRALGCAPSTIREWQAQAEDPQNTRKEAVFWREALEAEQLWLTRMSSNATSLAEKDGRVCVDMLGRRDPEHWRREDTLNVEVDVGSRIAGIVNEVIARSVSWEQIEGGENELQGPGEAERSGEEGGQEAQG